MVRQYAGYCGVAVVVSSGCLCLLSHSVWLLALWAVALLTAAVVAAYCSALIITAIMNEDFSCLAPKSLQCCSSSLSKKLINSVTKFIDAHMGAESRGRTMMPLCSAVLDTSLKTSKAPSLQVTSEEQPPPSDDSLIRSQLIDLSQRLHDQFVLPWYLCLSPDGLSHHQLCGVLEDVLLSCWQQLRVAGGLRSLLLDCCDLFSVLALAHSPLGHPSKRQRAAAGELGPQEYDQLSTLSQLVVLRHLPPLLLRCRGLVLLLRDLLTCNFVVPLFLKLCQPCLILQQWAAISAFSDGRVRDPSQTCDSRELQTSLLSDSRLSDQKARCAESRPGVGEELDVKNTVRDQSSAVALLQKKTSVTGRTTASLASSISQRKMLRRLLKHPNPIKIKTIFTKGVVDGMTEEDYKTSYFFNDLPRFIAPLNFHRGTYSWTHSCHKSEPSTPVHGTKAKLLVSRSESCSPVHFISRSTIQFAPGRRVSWSDPTLQLEQNSCLPKEEFTASLSKLNISGMRVLNETLTSVQDESFRQKSRDFSDVKSAYDGDKYQEIQTTTPTAGDQLYQAARSRCDTISKLNEKDLPTETKLNFNLCEKSPDFNVIESERILRPPYDESCYIRHVTKEHTGNGSLKTKASRVLSPSASNQQYLRVSVTGSSKSKNKITMSTCEERYDRETSLAPFSAPHSQLLLKKKKLVKMHSFDHFDGNIDPSLSPNVCTSCQVQCSHCIHGPGTPCVSHRVPCCLRTYRYRSGSCDEVSRRCDNYGCELLISNDNFSDDKLVVSSARDFILAPPLNEPPAQILASSVSSSNEHPSRVSLLTHPQDENTTLPPSFSESLSAQPPSHIDSGAPANYGSQTCLPSDQTSHSCLEFDSASRNLSESSKFKTRITNVNIKENLILKSDPTRRSEVVHFTGSEKNLHESSNSMNEQNGPTSNGGGISESDRELSRVTTMKQEMKSPNYETSADKLLSGLEHLSDSVFELDSDAIEASVAFSKSGEVDNSSKIAGPVDVAVKVAVPQGEMDQLDAGEGLVKGAASVEVSATSAQASDDAEELSPVYEEANNLESSIAKLRSLLSERHPHQSGGSGSSVGSSDSDLPLDPLTEVFPSRHISYRSAVSERTSARFSDAGVFMSDCSLTASDLTEPLPSVEQLPCRAVEGTVEVLEGRDVPRDGRLIVTCSIPGTVVENDPCGSPYTLYTLQYDALYVYDGSSGSKKLKMGKDDPISLKKVVPPSECTRSTVTDSERMVKKSAVTTSVRKINVADGKKESGVCDATIARGSSTSSTGKGEDKSKEDEDGTSDVCKPRSKCVTGKTTAQKHRLVLHTKFVQRRFREFVCLHNALWVHPKLRFSLRGVTGPSKWRHLPHGKLDSATVSMRRLFLENYMQILLQRIDINTSSIMRQFLCYDSDSKTGEYRTPFEIDWSLIPDSYSPREVSTSVEGAASRDQLFSRHQEEIALPYRAASEQTDTRPKAAICPEQRPTSLFCQDSSSSIASLSSFREPPHVSSATDELNEISLVNVLDIDNCELNIALTAELQPCAMEEALFEDFMVGDAAYSPDLQESSSDHHGVSVAPATAHNITNQPDLPVSSFLVPTLDQGLRKIYPEKNSLLVVSEPHCSPENTALIHAFHLSDLGNCVADSLSHALRLPLSYPDVGLLRRSVNTIKDCTMSTFSSSHPLASTSSMRPVDPLAAGGQEAVTTSAHDKHELSPQTSLLLTSKKMSSVNTETISLCDFSVDDSVPIVTHRRASVEGIGEAERETAFSRSPEIWNSCPHSIAVSSGPQSRSAELGVTEHVKGQVSWENLSSSRKENIQGEVSVHRLCHPSCRTPEESSSLHAASCSPSSSTLVPETSLKRPASTLLNILNGIQSVEHPYGDCIGVKYYCPNCSSRVKSCTRCEGSAIPDVTLPLQLVEELGDYSTSSTLASQSDRLHEKESGNVVFDTVIALLNSRQGRNGKTSSYVLTEPIVQLMVRWLVPSITAVIDDKLDQLFSDENVANFIHEILTNSNLEADSKAAKRCRNESVKFSPVLEYERFLAALGDSSLEDSHLDVDALKELLVSSMPDAVVKLGLGEELAQSLLLLLQDHAFSADFALEAIHLLCSHLLPQHH